VKLMLELFRIPYIPVDCLPMQERVRLVERVLALAGVDPVQPDPVLVWPTEASTSDELRPREGNGAHRRAENGAAR